MSAVQCPYCAQMHPPQAAFCPNTGRPLPIVPAFQQAPAAPQAGAGAYVAPPATFEPPPARAKSVGTILAESFEIYKKHLATLLVTSAILIVPLSLAKSAAIAVLLAPTAVVAAAADNAESLARQTSEQIQHQMEEAQRDPAKWQHQSAEQQKRIEDLSRKLATSGTEAVGGLMALVLGLLAMLVGVAVMYGIAVPIVTAALTVVVADRIAGGHVGPGEAYKVVLSRLGKYASAWIPAFALVVVGLFLLIIPGLIISFLFIFVAPVVLLENVGGIAALKRSVNLVKANVMQVAVVSLVFVVIRLVASLLTHLVIPSTAFFVDSLVQDLLLMFLLPVPIIGTVLLYLDIRRQADGLHSQEVPVG